MKALFYLLLISVTLLYSCTKSSTSNPVGRWRLSQKEWSLGSNGGIVKPSADSSVTLILKPDKTYRTELDGKTISQSTYSITADASSTSGPVLELNNFKPTGIFGFFIVSEIGANNQVISQFDGLYINITDGVLTLTSAITPGAFTSYTFVK